MNNLNSNNFGIDTCFIGQLGLSWNAPFYVDVQEDFPMISFSPSISLTLSSSFTLGFHLGFQEFYINFVWNALKLTPLKYLIMIDP